MTPEPARRCEECRSPLAADQRYCLTCGARAGARGAALEGLIHAAREGWRTSREASAAAPAVSAQPLAPGATGRAGSISRLPVPPLPPARVSALLVAVFLGFGALLGAAAASRVDNTLAAGAGSHLKLVLPPAAPAGGAGAGARAATASTASTPEAEPPAAEPEATPAPAATTPSTGTSSTPAAATPGPGAGEAGSSEAAAGAPASKLPPFKHVFVITLSNEPYASAFGPASTARYLAQTLERKGELLVRYDAIAHEQLANGVALLSGQGPTSETAANCPTYADLAATGAGPDGQVLGSGCIYPSTTQTLLGQLTAGQLTWRAYIGGVQEAGGAAAPCAHPPLGQPDPTAAPGSSTGPYATYRNPLVYFHSIIDTPSCASGDVGLARLAPDLARGAHAPAFSYIVPDRCHDGNPVPCAAGAPAGMGPADQFLRKVVPEITRSKAYRDGGLLVITVDEAPSSGEYADSSSCCGQPHYPNLTTPSTGALRHGGGTVGALLISRYVKGASTSQEPFNHFSLLRTIEDIFSLKHLGYAGIAAVKPFEPAMFTAKPSG